jgi:hypothetical protein
MGLHAPSTAVFVVSIIIAAVAIIGFFTPVPYVTQYGLWVAILAYVLLALGNLVKTEI